MGKRRLLRIMIKRNSLRATTPLVSDKIAKTLVARNALYEKELSDVYKTVDKEKNYCKSSFHKSKKELVRSLKLKDSADCASQRTCFLESEISGYELEVESRSRSSSLPMSLNLRRRTNLHLNRVSSLSTENETKPERNLKQECDSICCEHRPHSAQALYSPDSPVDIQFPLDSPSFGTEGSKDDVFGTTQGVSFGTKGNKDDVFESRQGVIDSESLGSSPTGSQIFEVDHEVPVILISEVENLEGESPQRKTSLTKRSYSTGDLQIMLSESQEQTPSPRSSPLLLRRTISSSLNSHYSQENWAEASDDKTKYGSLDESLFQQFNGMLSEKNIPQKPKPRPKPYTEEPFYLRKKCVIRRCLQNNNTTRSIMQSGQHDQEGRNQGGERPLSAILPPIALPPIYTQQSTKAKPNGNENEKGKNKPSGIKKNTAKINVNDLRLNDNLNDCRYLRNPSKR